MEPSTEAYNKIRDLCRRLGISFSDDDQPIDTVVSILEAFEQKMNRLYDDISEIGRDGSDDE